MNLMSEFLKMRHFYLNVKLGVIPVNVRQASHEEPPYLINQRLLQLHHHIFVMADLFDNLFLQIHPFMDHLNLLQPSYILLYFALNEYNHLRLRESHD